MAYVVYNRDTTRIAKRSNGDTFFATEAAAKRHVTRYLDPALYAVAEYTYFEDNIEKQVQRTNLMTGQSYTESVNTPNYMSPASEAYWSM
jgi:hypothetical protein